MLQKKRETKIYGIRDGIQVKPQKIPLFGSYKFKFTFILNFHSLTYKNS